MNSENLSINENIKNTNQKLLFENLKSDYILIKVLRILPKYKSLDIVKYNKRLQKRVHFDINDYKEYSQLYTPIEVELKLVDKNDDANEKFINISDEDKEYFHIYFNNSNEEIKRFYVNKNDKVQIIKIIIIILY